MNDAQRDALRRLCFRYNMDFDELAFGPGLGSADGWVEGWVGKHIYVGCSPEGNIHS